MTPIDPFVKRTRIAYFPMEIALRPEMRTYSGGLGVLAGDTVRTCADLELPVVFVTLASRSGYLRQDIDSEGRQIDHPEPWDPAAWTVPLGAMIAVPIEGREVWIRPWLPTALLHRSRARWIWMMKQSISKIGSHFNSQRMMRCYATEACAMIDHMVQQTSDA